MHRWNAYSFCGDRGLNDQRLKAISIKGEGDGGGSKMNAWGRETELERKREKKKKREKVKAHVCHIHQLSWASACLCSHLRHYITLWHCLGSFTGQNHIRSSLRFCLNHWALKQSWPPLQSVSVCLSVSLCLVLGIGFSLHLFFFFKAFLNLKYFI